MNVGRIGEPSAKPIKIDVKDRKILSFLENDSRMSLTQIAKKVALSRDAVNYRIKRLVDKQVILRFFPKINYKKLGYSTFHVFMLVDEKHPKKTEQLIRDLQNHPNTVSVIEYSDRWDLRIVFIAKNIEDFDNVLSEFVTRHPDTILERETIPIITEYYHTFLPNSYKNVTLDMPRARETDDASLDEKDVQILKILAKDCRVSTYEISRSINLSADAIGYRIKKLVGAGIIERFTILVNYSRINYSWYSYGMQMKIFDPATEARFKEFTSKHPYIVKSLKAIGGWDLILFVMADSATHYHMTIKELKKLFPHSIKNYEAWLAYKEHLFDGYPEILHSIKNIR